MAGALEACVAVPSVASLVLSISVIETAAPTAVPPELEPDGGVPPEPEGVVPEAAGADVATALASAAEWPSVLATVVMARPPAALMPTAAGT